VRRDLAITETPMKVRLTIACLLSLLLGCKGGAQPSTTALKPAGVITLDGVEGRIDHLAVDAKRGRLYVAALGNDTVEVIDLKVGKRVGSIAGLKKPQGVAVVAESGRLIVASGDDGKCRVYGENQKLLGTVDGLDDADNVRYDADAKLAYVGYGDGALAVIDPEAVKKVADIKLDGHPESFQFEGKGKRIFVNVPSAKQVVVIDRGKRAVVAKWEVKDAGANFPMALDEANHRLFLGCRKPAKVLVIDTESGRTVAAVDCAGDADDVFYDAARNRVYVSGGDGTVSVIEQSGPDGYKNVGKVESAAGARTSLFVPASGTLYVAVPHRGAQRCELRAYAASD
jgi:DNA-binding beta-propeller fold protein YncE